MNMTLADEFIIRYRREIDFYDQAARLVAQQLEQQSQASGIRAMVTYRAKSPDRLLKKVRQRASANPYKSVDDIYADIVDLAGVRVALYFPKERQEIDKIIQSQFVVLEPPREFPDASPPSRTKRFSGYWATHYRVKLRENILPDAQKRYSDARVEVQIASVLMHAWAEVEHDLVYKPQGVPSEDEYAILDELNGLVMAGEIVLERLQRAVEVRAGRRGIAFSNHYDLAAFLFEAVRPILRGPASNSALGRVDILFELLQELGLNTPESLDMYLSSLDSDVERRPVAEQIIDQVVAAEESRYAVYESIKESHEATHLQANIESDRASYAREAIGSFLSEWIRFERFIRELMQLPDSGQPVGIPTAKRLAQLNVFSDSMLFELESLRRVRNNLVHGVEIPDPSYISDAARRTRSILDGFQHSEDRAVREALQRSEL